LYKILGLVLLSSVLIACGPESPMEPAVPAAPGAEQSLDGVLQLVMVGDGTTASPQYYLAPAHRPWQRLLFDRRHDLVHQTGAAAGPTGHEHLGLAGKTPVHVRGVIDADGHLQVLELTALATDPSTSQHALVAAGPRKVAVILANFSNNRSRPLTVEQARAMVFTDAASTNAYYQEASFGAQSLTGKLQADGDVFGWYEIPRSSWDCDFVAWGDAARAAAEASGVDLSGYDHIVHYFPSSFYCGWSGVGHLPGELSWINGSGASTVAHELGHNLGLHHASSLSCRDGSGTRVTVGESCTSSEYGDPFDVMGKGFRHFNAFHKGRLGWLGPQNTLDVTASGTFQITPVARPSAGVQALRVPLAGTGLYYYVELRRPFGFDAFSEQSPVVAGALVHLAPDYDTILRPQLLDMNPATSSFNDAALPVGQTFTDSNAISITVNDVTADAATVTVSMP
jgi:hypothetical protein